MLSRMRTIALPRLHAAASASASGGASATGALRRSQRPRARGLVSAERGSALTARRFATDAGTASPSATTKAATASAGASSGSGKGSGKGSSSNSPWPRRGAIAAAAAGLLYVVSRSEERTLPPQPAKHIRGENKALQQQQQYSSAKTETAASPSAAAPASRAAAIQAASLASALPTATDAAAVPTGHAGAEEEPSPSHPDHASCRACRDGSEETAYLQQQAAAAAGASSAAGSSSDATVSPAASSSSSSSPPAGCPPCFAYSHSLCPLNRAEVGRASWGYLHTLAAYYPEHPTQRQRDEMAELIRLFMKLYPCAYCADRSVEQIEREPIQLHNASQRDLAQWMCRAHNEVNERIGKPIFDCKFVDQRWRDGPPTGECD